MATYSGLRTVSASTRLSRRPGFPKRPDQSTVLPKLRVMHPPHTPPGVILPLGQAFERMKEILFRPFDLYRWLCIGFTAWLASLGENWSGGGGGGGGSGNNGSSPPSLDSIWDSTRDYVADNAAWLIPTVVIGVFLIVALGLLIVWLNSRGRFMFLHNVALNRDDVVAPWHEYRRHADSLFFFRIVLGLIGFGLILPFLGIIGAATWSMLGAGELRPVALSMGIVAGLAVALIGLFLMVISKLTTDFVVPIMWMRQPTCRAAWTEFLGLLRPNLGIFFLYLLFYLLLSLGIAIAVVLVVLVTCCIAGCLFALPYLGTVCMLPVFVLLRAYSLRFLAQFGPEYDVFHHGGGFPPTAVPSPSSPT